MGLGRRDWGGFGVLATGLEEEPEYHLSHSFWVSIWLFDFALFFAQKPSRVLGAAADLGDHFAARLFHHFE